MSVSHYETWDKISNSHGSLLARFEPVRPDNMTQDMRDEFPEEVAIFKIEDRYPGGLIVYSRWSKSRDEWSCNTGERYAIRHLLSLLCEPAQVKHFNYYFREFSFWFSMFLVALLFIVAFLKAIMVL